MAKLRGLARELSSSARTAHTSHELCRASHHFIIIIIITIIIVIYIATTIIVVVVVYPLKSVSVFDNVKDISSIKRRLRVRRNKQGLVATELRSLQPTVNNLKNWASPTENKQTQTQSSTKHKHGQTSK